jgi:hypothetical protein
MGWIYIITNRNNGKSYIGQTTAKNVNRRWCEEKRAPHGLLKRAFNRWGIESFSFETICEIKPGEGWLEALDNRETLEIKQRNTLSPNGYNLESGGKRNKVMHEDTRRSRIGSNNSFYGKTHSDEAIEKIKRANTGPNNHRFGKPGTMRGRHHTDEYKLRRSELYSGINATFYGKHHSEETKTKLSIQHSQMIGAKAPRAKKVEKLHNGEWIKYDTARIAGKEVGTDPRNIGACCRGEQKTAAGFIWRFAN